jgi:hypothetical protein
MATSSITVIGPAKRSDNFNTASGLHAKMT